MCLSGNLDAGTNDIRKHLMVSMVVKGNGVTTSLHYPNLPYKQNDYVEGLINSSSPSGTSCLKKG